jgi:hypothetical protein
VIYAEPERARGRSFHGLLDYILHDAGRAATADRVLFAETVNLVLGLRRAADEMQDTVARSLRSRRRGQRPDRLAFHFVLSWHPEDRPTPEHMLATGRDALRALGLDSHQAVIAGHTDTDQRHVHVAVNVIDPDTGKAAKLQWRHRTMSRWARAYEEAQGEVRCHRRGVPRAANENRKRLHRAAWNKARQREKQKADTRPALRP